MGMVVVVASGVTTAPRTPSPRRRASRPRSRSARSIRRATRAATGSTTRARCSAPMRRYPAPDQVVCFSDSATSLSRCSRPARSGSSPTRAERTLFRRNVRRVAGRRGRRGAHAAGPPARCQRPRSSASCDRRIGHRSRTAEFRATPRLDVLAAVQFDPSTFFLLGSAPGIPDGSGSAERLLVTISGFAGSIAGVEVWSRDRSRIRSLRASR